MPENIHMNYIVVQVEKGKKSLEVFQTSEYHLAHNRALDLSTTQGNKRKTYEVWFWTIEHRELKLAITNGRVNNRAMHQYGKDWP